MDINIGSLPRAEQLPLLLRNLYESYGYLKYRMGRFEQYDLYMENRNFLRGEGIITFTDATGRLMALKPDITMSMVKNADPEGAIQKYYYNESVYRIEQRGEEYREISQMGVEYFGAELGYAEAEVINLALKTMGIIGGSYKLDLSHMGFISGLIEYLGLSDEGEVLDALRQKNRGAMQDIARRNKFGGDKLSVLETIAGLRGGLGGVLKDIRELAKNETMLAAVRELEELYGILEIMGNTDHLCLDFSIVNDVDYYNGILLRGYVQGAPRAVLAGGRYDNLMRRFGKEQQAIGFAVYLSDLERVLYYKPEYDVDVLVCYGGADAPLVARIVEGQRAGGKIVRAESRISGNVTAREIFYISPEGKLSEVQND
jgi:ATP phosphoribosyltransferase regulatory subunit